jgi:hypothetical protein
LNRRVPGIVSDCYPFSIRFCQGLDKMGRRAYKTGIVHRK